MRIAPKGKYFIKGQNVDGKTFYPFYDGFKNLKQAQDIAHKLNVACTDCIHIVETR